MTSGAEFDERFRQNPRSVLRFRRMEAPLRAVAARAHALLDLGCGTGRVLAELPPAPGALRAGIDLSAELLQQAAARGFAVLRADAHRLPFAGGSFDAVIAANAVFRYLRTADALAECHRVLRPGGRLALHQYAARTLSLRGARRRPLHPGHLRTLADLRDPAAAAGFSEQAVHLWRGIRVYPYVIPIPAVTAPLRLWDHVILIFRRH